MTTHGDLQVDWYRVPLPPSRLQELNRRSNTLGMLQAGGHLGLMAATGGAAIYISLYHSLWWLIPVLFLHGTVCAFAINAVHELVHGTVFRWRWLNETFAHLFAFVGWINHRGFWASHAEHHRYTLFHPHDGEVVLPVHLQFRNYLSNGICNPRAAWHQIRSHFRTARGELNSDWERHLLEGQERHRDVMSWSRTMLIGHAALAAASLYHGLWIVPVVVSLTPCYGRLLQMLLNQTQHVGLQDQVRDFRRNCRTIEVNALFRFLYWHMNYHIEHHMYAAVPCYRLRALHKEIAHALPPTPQGLVETWFHIIGVLYRQREEPGYQYQARLPEQDGAETAPAISAPVSMAEDAEEPAPLAVDRDATAPIRAEPAPSTNARIWECAVCGFIYDEALGLPEEDIPPGTAWADISDDWRCPDCGVGKADFEMVEITQRASA